MPGADAGASTAGIRNEERGTNDRGITEGTDVGVSPAGVRTGQKDMDRGADKKPLFWRTTESNSQSIQRLVVVARIAFQERNVSLLRTLGYPTDPTLQEILVEAYQSFGVVGPLARKQLPDETAQQYLDEVAIPRWEKVRSAYQKDLSRLISTVKEKGFYWLKRSLNYNSEVLGNLETDMLDPSTVQSIYQAAKEYQIKRQRYLHGIPRETAGIVNKEFTHIERGLSERIENKWLKILFTYSNRETLFFALALGPKQAENALREVFENAREGIQEFREDIKEDRNHIWRYPPIVAGVAQEILTSIGQKPEDRNFVQFLLNLSRELSGSAFGGISFVAGVAIIAVSVLFFPAGEWLFSLLTTIDAGISGVAATRDFRREKENELAMAVSVLGQGQPFTNRKPNYGTFALQVLATLLTAAQLLRILPRPKVVNRGSKVADSLPPGEPPSLTTTGTRGIGAKARAKGSPTEQAIEQAEKGKSGGKEISPDISVSNEARGAKLRSTSDRGAETKPEPAEPISKKGREDIRNVDKQIKPEERSTSDTKVEDQRALNRSTEYEEATKAKAMSREAEEKKWGVEARTRQARAKTKMEADFEEEVFTQLAKKERPFAVGDEEVRKKLGIPRKPPELAADRIGIGKGGQFNITEVKATTGETGAEIPHGLAQINNTLVYMHKKFPDVKIGEIQIVIPENGKIPRGYRVSKEGGRNFLMEEVDGKWRVYRTEIGNHFVVIRRM